MRVNYILIAEDDEDDQYLLTSAFNEIAADTKLVFVQNGIELVNYISQIEAGTKALPSLLVVDLNMPKKNGKEALRELITKPCFRQFPTIVFSTTGNELERKRCEELGISEYFVKPSNYGNLLQLVGRFQELARTVKAS